MIESLAVAFAIVFDLVAVQFRSRAAVIAENLFLRRQLALYFERKTRRRRPTPATEFALVMLGRFFSWAGALAIVMLGCDHPLAPNGIPSLLALEVSARGSSSAT